MAKINDSQYFMNDSNNAIPEQVGKQAFFYYVSVDTEEIIKPTRKYNRSKVLNSNIN